MTYEEFLAGIGLLDSASYEQYIGYRTMDEIYQCGHAVQKDLISDLLKRVIATSWSPGGMSGGNCWDSAEPTHYTSNESEQEIPKLLEIYEKVCPNISWLQGSKIAAELKKRKSYTDWEYYGNSTDNVIVYINLKELYDYLTKNKIIE